MTRGSKWPWWLCHTRNIEISATRRWRSGPLFLEQALAGLLWVKTWKTSTRTPLIYQRHLISTSLENQVSTMPWPWTLILISQQASARALEPWQRFNCMTHCGSFALPSKNDTSQLQSNKDKHKISMSRYFPAPQKKEANQPTKKTKIAIRCSPSGHLPGSQLFQYLLPTFGVIEVPPRFGSFWGAPFNRRFFPTAVWVVEVSMKVVGKPDWLEKIVVSLNCEDKIKKEDPKVNSFQIWNLRFFLNITDGKKDDVTHLKGLYLNWAGLTAMFPHLGRESASVPCLVVVFGVAVIFYVDGMNKRQKYAMICNSFCCVAVSCSSLSRLWWISCTTSCSIADFIV